MSDYDATQPALDVIFKISGFTDDKFYQLPIKALSKESPQEVMPKFYAMLSDIKMQYVADLDENSVERNIIIARRFLKKIHTFIGDGGIQLVGKIEDLAYPVFCSAYLMVPHNYRDDCSLAMFNKHDPSEVAVTFNEVCEFLALNKTKMIELIDNVLSPKTAEDTGMVCGNDIVVPPGGLKIDSLTI